MGSTEAGDSGEHSRPRKQAGKGSVPGEGPCWAQGRDTGACWGRSELRASGPKVKPHGDGTWRAKPWGV